MATDLRESATSTLAPETRIVLHGVSWDVYAALRAEPANWRVRMTFDRGELEIMSPSLPHESYAALLGRIISVVTEECGIPLRTCRSTTWQSPAAEKGLEADDCFYIRNAGLIRGRSNIDLAEDPPPDLAIEVEITSDIVSKIPIYRTLGVPELWRCDGETLRTYRLDEQNQYVEQAQSLNLPTLPLEEVMQQVHRLAEDDLDETEWVRGVRQWVREKVAVHRE